MWKVVVRGGAVAIAGVVMATLPFGAVAQDTPDLRFAYVTTARGHAEAVMEAGARQAAADLGVALGYESVRSVDPVRVAERIDAAVAAGPDGLVIAADDIVPMGTSIREAAAVGIPIVWVGQQTDTSPPRGVDLRVVPDDTLAGLAAGRQLGILGVRNALCLKVDVHMSADSRCSGAAKGLAEGGGRMDVLTAIDPAGDPSGVRGAVAARLLADPTIDGVLMTDASSTPQTLAAIMALGRPSDPTVAAFGIDTDVLDALDAGTMAFAVDGQPFLHGYLPIMALALDTRAGLSLGGREPLVVGSVIVTREDAAQVRTSYELGVR